MTAVDSRHDQRHAEPHDDHHRENAGPERVILRQCDEPEGRERRADDKTADGDGQLGPDSIGQFSDTARQECDEDRERQKEEARLGGADAPAGDQQHRQIEQDRRQREIEEEGRNVRAAEGAIGKQAEVHHGLGRASLPEDECRDDRQACHDRQQRPARRSAVSAFRQDRQSIGEQAETDRGEHRAVDIERLLAAGRIGRNLGRQQPDRHGAQRQVDGEDRPPDRIVEGREREAANHRAEGGGHGGRRRPDADRPAPLRFRIGLGDDGQAARHHDRRAAALHGTKHNKQRGIRRESAGDRGGGEEDDAGDEGEPEAESVAGSTPRQDQRRQCQRIGVGDPLRVGERSAEIGANRRHGDGNHRSIDEPHARREDRGGQNEGPARGRTEAR